MKQVIKTFLVSVLIFSNIYISNIFGMGWDNGFNEQQSELMLNEFIQEKITKETLEKYLKNGADPNYPYNGTKNALGYLVKSKLKNSIELAKILLEKSTNPDALAELYPLSEVQVFISETCCNNFLNYDRLVHYIIESITEDTENTNPLLILELILKHGANINLAGKYGVVPIIRATNLLNQYNNLLNKEINLITICSKNLNEKEELKINNEAQISKINLEINNYEERKKKYEKVIKNLKSAIWLLSGKNDNIYMRFVKEIKQD